MRQIKVLTKKDLARLGFDKGKIMRFEREGRLVKGYGYKPGTAQVMVGYMKTEKFDA